MKQKSDYLHIHSAYCHFLLFTNPQTCHSPASSSTLDLCFLPPFPVATTVGMTVLAEALKNISNTEKRGNCQALLRPHSKVTLRFPPVMVKHGSFRFSRAVVSDSLRPQGLPYARPPCSLLELAQTHVHPVGDTIPTISPSVVPFFSSLQSCPASGSFLRSQFFTSVCQSIRVSVPVLPMDIQDWFPLGLTGWMSLQSKGLSRVFPNTTVQKHQKHEFLSAQLSL